MVVELKLTEQSFEETSTSEKSKVRAPLRYQKNYRNPVISGLILEGCQIGLVLADQMLENTNCLVHLTKDTLNLENEFSQRLKFAAGENFLENAVKDFLKDKDPIIPGKTYFKEVVKSETSKLECNQIVTLIIPTWEEEKKKECRDQLQQAFMNILKNCDDKQNFSISFPETSDLIPQEIYGEVLLQSVEEYLISRSKNQNLHKIINDHQAYLKHIRICCDRKKTLDYYDDLIKKMGERLLKSK